MIVVNSGLKQNEIISLVENLEVEGTKPFKFSKKQGLKLIFESTYGDDTKAIAIIKSEIKANPIGQSLFFSVAAQ